MKNRTLLIISLFSILAAGCTGRKAENTTPGTETNTTGSGKVEPGPVKDAAPASDLCTGAQCPGVVL